MVKIQISKNQRKNVQDKLIFMVNGGNGKENFNQKMCVIERQMGGKKECKSGCMKQREREAETVTREREG